MLQVLEEETVSTEQGTGLAEIRHFCYRESCRHEAVLHWKDKSKEAKGSQPKDHKGTPADITEGNCSKLLLLSKNTFLGNFGEMLSLYLL